MFIIIDKWKNKLLPINWSVLFIFLVLFVIKYTTCEFVFSTHLNEIKIPRMQCRCIKTKTKNASGDTVKII